jgi:uncharacterized protein DUF4352
MRGGWFSPDGHWWWNGREWRPAAEAMRPRGGTFWILACALGLLVFFGVGTCGLMFGTATRGGPTGSASRATGASSGVQACSPRPCADAGGFTVVVERVEWHYVPSAFFTAEPGNQFARVTVRFENHASDERHADPFQFVLKDQQGVKHAITSAGDSWSGVNLTPGGTFGPRSLDFQVTKGTTAGALIWTPDLRDHEVPLT